MQPRRVYSKKSQFGQESRDHLEQIKNLQMAQTVDCFSIVDLEFRKVDLQRHIKIKSQEIDESDLERQTLLHTIESE